MKEGKQKKANCDVATEKPKNCIGCYLMPYKACGKEHVYRGNGSIQYQKAPDDRCRVRR